jgi:hypothetical protein
MTRARKWDHSVCDTSYPYELIGAQIQTLFMLLRDKIRHNQRGSGLNQARSRRLTLAQGELISAQPQLELLTNSSHYTPA